jgi:hypothetical protein
MPRALLLTVAALALALLSGCASFVPFSHELRDEHALTAPELKNIQFYISSKVTLRRELDSNEKIITGSHKLVLVSGKRVEEVVFKSETPGVAVDVGAKSIAISFEPGASLVFTAQSERFAAPIGPVTVAQGFATAPEPFPGNGGGHDRDRDTHPNVFGNYLLTFDGDGSVVYQGKRWEVVADGGDAHLLIDAKALKNTETTTKVVPGMKLN